MKKTDASAFGTTKTLLELAGLENLQSLALIGMSKNAGKTTCLNHIITAWQASGQTRPLAITSIGRDGEPKDIVSGREKPHIYIPAGTLIASAQGALKQSDALLEILELSNIRTALGEVVICRALSDGYVELAGPGSAEEIGVILDLVRSYEPDCLFIIDGALSRRSQAGSGVSEAVILAVSADTSLDPELLAEKTRFALEVLQTPALGQTDKKLLLNACQANPHARALIAIGKVQTIAVEIPSLVGYGKEIAKNLVPETRILYLRGAITDQILNELLKETNFTHLSLVAEDGTRIFLKPEIVRKLRLRNIDLAVINPIDVRMVCLNPTRTNGQTIDSQILIDKMKQTVKIPVVDLGPALL